MFDGDLGFYTWFAFRVLFIGLLVLYVLGGLDDLIIDFTHYSRVIFRALFRRKQIKPVTKEQLDSVPEKAAAIIVPAWDESNVISRMLLNTASTLLYRNYYVFVGTYPNDEATKLEVEKVREVFPNIEVVVTPANGPTNKADCLNWVYQGIMLFEKENDIRFEIFVFHDAEDVIHPLSMKYYNYLIPRVKFIQIPVFPFEQSIWNFPSGVYMDEFAENHMKDMRARELLSSAIPSAGVGTALGREALDYLAKERRNQIFDITSLTEDYMMGMLLKDMPGKKIFLQQWIDRTVQTRSLLTGRQREKKVGEPIATREFFPNTFETSIRQKSRWILGISIQGWNAGWGKTLGMNYCLFRDRKSVFTNLLVILGYIVVLFWFITQTFGTIRPEWALPPLIEKDEVWFKLGYAVIGLFIWRLINRVGSVWAIYGPKQGFMSIPRFFYGNIVNFCATWLAIKRYIISKRTGKVPEWGKTSHAYPTEDQLRGFHRKLGDLLLERRLITTAQLESAIKRQTDTGHKLGEVLVEMGALWEEDLIMALAHQKNEHAVEIDPHTTDHKLFELVPRDVAEKYRIYPLERVGEKLVLATDAHDRKKLADQLRIKFGFPVELKWTSAADIHFAISRGYAKERVGIDPATERLGHRLVKDGVISAEDLNRALRTQKRSNQKLGEILVEMKLISPSDLNEELKK